MHMSSLATAAPTIGATVFWSLCVIAAYAFIMGKRRWGVALMVLWTFLLGCYSVLLAASAGENPFAPRRELALILRCTWILASLTMGAWGLVWGKEHLWSGEGQAPPPEPGSTESRLLDTP